MHFSFVFHQRGFGVDFLGTAFSPIRAKGRERERKVKMWPEQRLLLREGCAEPDVAFPFKYRHCKHWVLGK